MGEPPTRRTMDNETNRLLVPSSAVPTTAPPTPPKRPNWLMRRVLQFKDQGSFGRINSAYALSCMGDRLWVMTSGLLVESMGGLRMVCWAQGIDCAANLILSAQIADKLDRMNRNTAIQRILIFNNLFICIACVLGVIIFGNWFPEIQTFLQWSLIICSALSKVASEIQKTAFNKDWIVTLSHDDEDLLSSQNARMATIDQAASLIMPIIAGGLLDNTAKWFVCGSIILWNVASWYLESNILGKVYHATPELHRATEDTEREKMSWLTFAPFRKFAKQEAILSMVGFAFLFMTVLGFDNISIAYGRRNGFSYLALTAMRAMGSALAIFGLSMYKSFTKKFHLLVIPVIGLSLQFIMLQFAWIGTTVVHGHEFDPSGFMANNTVSSLASDFVARLNGAPEAPLPVPESTLPFYLFICGVMLARFGLWMADPAMGQIVQTTVPEPERYSVNIVLNLLCEMFGLIKDLSLSVVPHREMFGFFVICSTISVAIGFTLYLCYWLKHGCPVKLAARPVVDTELLSLPSSSDVESASNSTSPSTGRSIEKQPLTSSPSDEEEVEEETLRMIDQD